MDGMVSADGLVDEEDEVVVTRSEEGAWFVADVGEEVEADDADPAGWKGGIELLGD